MLLFILKWRFVSDGALKTPSPYETKYVYEFVCSKIVHTNLLLLVLLYGGGISAVDFFGLMMMINFRQMRSKAT